MKFKVGDTVKVLSAYMDTHLIGKTVKVTKVEDSRVWVEGGSSSWSDTDGFLQLIKSSTERKNIMRKRYMLLKETYNLKKGAVVEEQCDDGTQPFELVEDSFYKGDIDDYDFIVQDRSLIENNPTWWEEVVPVYAPKRLYGKVMEMLGAKTAKRGRGRPKSK